jgi:DNA-binding Lrp family transcriptional regulator
MLSISLNDKDCSILRILQKNADITNAELAKQVDLSPSACLTRVKKLKADQLIRGISATLNANALGLNFHVFIYIRSSKSREGYAVLFRGRGQNESQSSRLFPNDWRLRLCPSSPPQKYARTGIFFNS